MSKIFRYGSNFVMSSAKKGSRKSVGQLLDTLQSQIQITESSPGRIRLDDEEKLDEVWAFRIGQTVISAMTSLSLCKVFGFSHPLISSEGARIQDLSLESDTIRQNGKVLQQGWQAAHVCIGSNTLRGKDVAVFGRDHLLQFAIEHHIPPQDFPAVFPHMLALLEFALTMNGATYDAPAFINQSDGQYERVLQYYAKGLASGVSLDSSAQSLHDIAVIGTRKLEMLTNMNKVCVTPLERRYFRIRNGTLKGYNQNPTGKGAGLFGDKEEEYLEAEIEMRRNRNSKFYLLIDEQLGRKLSSIARLLNNWTEGAREEIWAAAQTKM